MNNIRTLLIAVTLIVSLFAAPAKADTLITRFDSYKSEQPSYTVGVLTKDLEIWTFGIGNKNFSELNIGKELIARKGENYFWSASLYMAYLPNSEEFYALPWFYGSVWSGRAVLDGSIAPYIPLNGGTYALFSNELFAGYKPTDSLKVGLAASLYDLDGYDATVRVGPTVKWKNWSVRYLFGRDGDDSFRVQYSRGF